VRRQVATRIGSVHNPAVFNDEAESRDALRTNILAGFSRYYSSVAHLLFPSAFGVTLMALAASGIRALRFFELGWIVLFFVIANAVEWHAHKHLLHKRRWWLAVAYDRHTPIHHRVFVAGDMAIRARRELGIVLIPAYGIVAILLICLPTAFLLDRAGLANAARLFIATMMGYVLLYEWLHLAYHAPASSLVGRSRVIRRLRAHHARHHDPALMQRWNFNITLPLWDYLCGTIFNAEETTEARHPRRA
jgi:hypothetical protein